MKIIFNAPILNSIDEIKDRTRYSFLSDKLCEIKTEDLKYIEDDHIVDFSFCHPLFYSVEEQYKQLHDFILRLDKNGNKCKVIVESKWYYREIFNSMFLKDKLKNVKLYIYSDDNCYSLRSYLKE